MFCVGFEELGGITRKLDRTAFLVYGVPVFLVWKLLVDRDDNDDDDDDGEAVFKAEETWSFGIGRASALDPQGIEDRIRVTVSAKAASILDQALISFALCFLLLINEADKFKV